MIDKIVSGGQTGVDQAALLAALDLGFAMGGWCPKGGLDENGDCILTKYPDLKEATTSHPDERTKLNVADSDGTLIVVPNWPLSDKIKDGTRLAIQQAKKQGKPYFLINLVTKEAQANHLKEWLIANNVHILNIAGPRESNSPGIHKVTYDFLRYCLSQFKIGLK